MLADTSAAIRVCWHRGAAVVLILLMVQTAGLGSAQMREPAAEAAARPGASVGAARGRPADVGGPPTVGVIPNPPQGVRDLAGHARSPAPGPFSLLPSR